MTNALQRVLGSTIIAMIAGSTLGGARQAPSSGLVVGHVVDATSGGPVPRAIVTLAKGALARPQSVMADETGGFVFTDLAAGAYALTSTKSGFADGAYGRRRPDGPAQSLDLAAGQRMGDVTIAMWRYAMIAGVVTDEADEPIVGVGVQPLTRVFVAGRARLGAAGNVLPADELTDDRGAFRFSNLLPGDYVLVVTSRSVSAAPAVDGRPRAYPNTFVPDVTASSQAGAISVSAGEVKLGQDLHLRLLPAISVSGTLTGPDGAPVAHEQVRLSPAAMAEDLLTEGGFDALAVTTDASGRFVFAAVPSGPYVLRAARTPRPAGLGGIGGAASSPAAITDDEMLWAVEPITVGTGDATIAVRMHAGLHVSGRFLFDGVSPKPSPDRLRQIPVVLERIDGRPATSGLFSRPGTGDEHGAFRSQALPAGRYLVRIGGSPAGWTFKSATIDGVDVADTPFELTRDVADAVVTFSDKDTRISGTIRSPQGTADPEADALLFPVDPAGWVDFGVNPRRLRSVRAGPGGVYTLSHVPAGDYFVVAIPDASAEQWNQPATLAALSRLATRVHVQDGDTMTRDLRTVVRP